MNNLIARIFVPLIFGALALSGGQALAQQEGQQEQQQMQLSEKAKKATARLHALAQARAAFASAAAQRAQDPQAKEFLQQRAQDYMEADQKVVSFAESRGVDLGSREMQKEIQKHQKEWMKELEKIQQAEPPKATDMALQTFVERNDKAVKDLETLRGEVQETELRNTIDEMISSIEEESTKAEELRAQVKSAEQKRQG